MKRRLLFVLALTLLNANASLAQGTQPAAALRLGVSAATTPTSLHTAYGPVHFGAAFGITMTADDITFFSSPTLANQAMLAGQVDIVSASFVSSLALRQAGADVKVFCPAIGTLDYVLVGRNGITKIEQLFDPKTRVAIDDPTSPISADLNAMFQAHHLNKSIADLPNAKTLANPSLKQAAWENNDADATLIHLPQFEQSKAKIPDAVIIDTLYNDVPTFLSSTFAAPTQWLNTHLDQAAGFCAAVLKAGHDLTANFSLFSQAAHELIAKPPADASLQESFDFVRKYDSWLLQAGLNADEANYMIDLATKSRILKQPIKADEILDLRAYQMALKLLPADYQPGTPVATDAALAGTPSVP